MASRRPSASTHTHPASRWNVFGGRDIGRVCRGNEGRPGGGRVRGRERGRMLGQGRKYLRAYVSVHG